MLERIKKFAGEIGPDDDDDEDDEEQPRLVSLRAAAAQLLLATGAGATLEHVARRDPAAHPIPAAIAWAPALIGPLTAAANMEHARRPSDQTRLALRILTAASVGFGATLFVYDALTNRQSTTNRVAPLAFASAGLLGLVLDREEVEIEETERELRQRAKVVERLVPKRRAKLDRIVVHV